MLVVGGSMTHDFCGVVGGWMVCVRGSGFV